MSSVPPPLSQGPPPLDQAPPPGWWGRNWKWMIPTCVVVTFGAIAAFIFLIFSFVMGMMKSSTPFKEAMSRANASEQVKAALGTPVESGMFVSGSINTSGSSGNAFLVIPVSGPKGEGLIRLEAKMSGGTWTYSTLHLHPSGQTENIDLKP